MFSRTRFRVVLIPALLLAAAVRPAVAQDAPPACPVFVTAGDPAYCHVQVAALPEAEDASEIVPLAYDPETGLRLLSRRPLFGPGEISLLTRSREAAGDTPLTGGDRIAVTSDDSAALQPRSMSSAYDLPIFDGLALDTTSAVSQRVGDGGTDDPARSVNSKFGLAYEEYGLRFKVNPNAAVNWGDLAGSGNRRLGIDNQVSTTLARDLTLTLSSGYDSTAYAGNALANTASQRHRIALAQHFQSGYRLGVSGQRRNDTTRLQEQDANILGLMVGVPLGESLNLTANHEFGLTQKRDLQASNALPLAGNQQMLDLQLHWTPAALASRAMTLMAGYTVTQQSESGLADPYLSQARLNLAMRF